MLKNPTIKCFPNGPYFIKKDAVPEVMLNIPGADGDTTTSGAGVTLCRCGGSKNKPYCDGSHSNNGFSDKKLADDSLDRRDTYIGAQITIHDNRGICAHAGICTNQLADVFKTG